MRAGEVMVCDLNGMLLAVSFHVFDCCFFGGDCMARYGKKSQEKVKKVMEEFKEGKLRSGSGKKVRDRKQATAIGLSEARKSGAKVPPPPDK